MRWPAHTRVSHETIYAYAYCKEGQSEELARYLPSRRKKLRLRYERRDRHSHFEGSSDYLLKEVTITSVDGHSDESQKHFSGQFDVIASPPITQYNVEVDNAYFRNILHMLRSIADVDLRLLRVFDTVARCGGFAAAQSALNVSQANISMQMKQLEERLGVTLCHRGRTGFWLTQEGKTVLDACHVLFRSLDEFRAAVSATAGTISGRLHLSIVDNSIFNEKFRLASAIRKFKEKSPNSEIVINVAATNDVEQMVLDGSCDLGVGFFPARRQGLNYHSLFTSGMNLYCGMDSPLFSRAPDYLAVEDVLSEEHAARAYVSTTQLPSFEKKFSVGASAANIEGLMTLILSGKYTAYLPEHYADVWVRRKQIRPLLPDRLGYRCLYEVASKPRRQRSELLELFLETLLQEHDPVDPDDYRIGSDVTG